MAPWLHAARRKAAASGQAKASRWVLKVAFEVLGPPLMAAKVAPSVRDAVVEALFGEIQISAEYWPAHAKEYRRAKSHLLGMIRTGLVSYLVVHYDG